MKYFDFVRYILEMKKDINTFEVLLLKCDVLAVMHGMPILDGDDDDTELKTWVESGLFMGSPHKYLVDRDFVMPLAYQDVAMREATAHIMNEHPNRVVNKDALVAILLSDFIAVFNSEDSVFLGQFKTTETGILFMAEGEEILDFVDNLEQLFLCDDMNVAMRDRIYALDPDSRKELN